MFAIDKPVALAIDVWGDINKKNNTLDAFNVIFLEFVNHIAQICLSFRAKIEYLICLGRDYGIGSFVFKTKVRKIELLIVFILFRDRNKLGFYFTLESVPVFQVGKKVI